MSESHARPEFLDQAEAEKLKAEAEAARATAAKEQAEARKLTAEADEAECKVARARIDLAREQYKRDKELASDEFHHTYLFDKDVSEASVKACIAQLSAWERTSAGPITVELIINSPGGSVVDGFALIDHIASMHARDHVVNTTAYGMAASMAGVLLQVGRERRMGSNALLLIHEAQFGAMGSYGEIQDRMKMVDIMHDRILDLFASRSKVSKAFIKRNWLRKDWWLPAHEAAKHGFIDQIV